MRRSRAGSGRAARKGVALVPGLVAPTVAFPELSIDTVPEDAPSSVSVPASAEEDDEDDRDDEQMYAPARIDPDADTTKPAVMSRVADTIPANSKADDKRATIALAVEEEEDAIDIEEDDEGNEIEEDFERSRREQEDAFPTGGRY